MKKLAAYVQSVVPGRTIGSVIVSLCLPEAKVACATWWVPRIFRYAGQSGTVTVNVPPKPRECTETSPPCSMSNKELRLQIQLLQIEYPTRC